MLPLINGDCIRDGNNNDKNKCVLEHFIFEFNEVQQGTLLLHSQPEEELFYLIYAGILLMCSLWD